MNWNWKDNCTIGCDPYKISEYKERNHLSKNGKAYIAFLKKLNSVDINGEPKRSVYKGEIEIYQGSGKVLTFRYNDKNYWVRADEVNALFIRLFGLGVSLDFIDFIDIVYESAIKITNTRQQDYYILHYNLILKDLETDYKKKYESLYTRVAYMLVKNYKSKEPMTPYQLLLEWNKIRDKE